MAFRAVNRTNDPKWRRSSGQPSFGEGLADYVNPTWGDITTPNDGYAIATGVYSIAAGETWTKGALIRLDVNTKVTELSSISQSVKGVALEPVTSGVSLGLTPTKALIAFVKYTNTDSGKISYTRFAVADKDGATPLAAHVGSRVALYVTGSEWYIDVDDTSNQDVEIVGYERNRGEFIVQFLDAIIQ